LDLMGPNSDSFKLIVITLQNAPRSPDHAL
jgi:hypothetical protein